MKDDFDIIDLDQTDSLPQIRDIYDEYTEDNNIEDEYTEDVDVSIEYTEEVFEESDAIQENSEEYEPDICKETAEEIPENHPDACEEFAEEEFYGVDEENAGSEVFQGEVSVDTILMSDISDAVNEQVVDRMVSDQFTGSVDIVNIDEITEEGIDDEEIFSEDEARYEGEEYDDQEYEGEEYDDQEYEGEEYDDQEYEEGDIRYGEEGYDEAVSSVKSGNHSKKRQKKRKQKSDSLKEKLLAFFGNFTVGDWVTAGMGIVIVCVAITIFVVLGNRNSAVETSNMYAVGQNFSTIGIAGESGLIAMADAHMVTEEEIPEETPEFISVEITFTSVERDLKIKFVDITTNRLITDVAFEVVLVGSERITFKDEDLDGIIYDNDVKPGEYSVEIVPMEGYEFTEYPSTVTVKNRLYMSRLMYHRKLKLSRRLMRL